MGRSNMIHLPMMPESLLIVVLDFASVEDVISLSASCRRFNQITTLPFVWNSALQKYPIALSQTSTVTPCKENAVHLLRVRRIIQISKLIPWLSDCLRQYEFAPGLLLSIICRICELVANERLRYLAFLNSIPATIQNLVISGSSDELLKQACLRTLIVLSRPIENLLSIANHVLSYHETQLVQQSPPLHYTPIFIFEQYPKNNVLLDLSLKLCSNLALSTKQRILLHQSNIISIIFSIIDRFPTHQSLQISAFRTLINVIDPVLITAQDTNVTNDLFSNK